MKRFVPVCCALLCVCAAHAQTNAVRTLSLEEAIQLAVQHNLQVQIDRLTPQISKFNYDSDLGYYDPTFSTTVKKSHDLSGGFNPATGLFDQTPTRTDQETLLTDVNGNTPWGLNYKVGSINNPMLSHLEQAGRPDEYDTSVGISATQPLLKNFWIDTSRYNISIAKQQIKADEFGFRSTLIDVISATEQAYYELIFDYENIKVQQAAVERAERLAAENKRRVEVGSMAPLDEKQAESQAASARADLIAAYGLLDKQQNVLKNLITDNYGPWHDAQIAPSQSLLALPKRFDLQESWEQGIAINPGLQRAKAVLTQNNITVKYRYNQVFPQLDVTGSYGRNGRRGSLSSALDDIPDNRFPFYSYGAVLSIPLNNRSARYAYKASKASAQQQLLTVKQTEQNVLVSIDDNIKTANTDYQKVQATRSAREYAELALQAEQKKLAVGKSTSFEVLSLQKDLTTARSQEIRALADYNQDLSKVAQSIGSTLEKFHITVSIY